MSDRLHEMSADTGVRAHVALVTFADPDRLDEYQQRRALPIPMLMDTERAVYALYGLPRGSFSAVWGPATITRYWQILRRSGPGSMRDVAPATEDTRQLGGDMVIAPDGTLAWGHWSTGPADRPTIDDLVDAVATASMQE